MRNIIQWIVFMGVAFIWVAWPISIASFFVPHQWVIYIVISWFPFAKGLMMYAMAANGNFIEPHLAPGYYLKVWCIAGLAIQLYILPMMLYFED